MEWKVEGRGDTFAVLDEADNEIATVPYEPLRGVDAPDSAEYRRAALIAAAPELLEALEAIVATDAPCPFPHHDPRYAEWFRLLGGDGIVLAAIAKAKAVTHA